MPNAAEIDAMPSQRTKTRTTVYLDADADLEIERLDEALEDAKVHDAQTNEPDTAPAIARQIIELKEQSKDCEVEFVFAGLGHRQYTDLQRAHQPSEEQKSKAKEIGQRASWNEDTFPPALLAASCVSPAGTDVAWWLDKYENWTFGQMTRLFRVCLGAQVGVLEPPKALAAYEMIHGSEPSSDLPGT